MRSNTRPVHRLLRSACAQTRTRKHTQVAEAIIWTVSVVAALSIYIHTYIYIYTYIYIILYIAYNIYTYTQTHTDGGGDHLDGVGRGGRRRAGQGALSLDVCYVYTMVYDVNII
jgi:cobalamin synthase